jgi:hypothetical protein
MRERRAAQEKKEDSWSGWKGGVQREEEESEGKVEVCEMKWE